MTRVHHRWYAIRYSGLGGEHVRASPVVRNKVQRVGRGHVCITGGRHTSLLLSHSYVSIPFTGRWYDYYTISVSTEQDQYNQVPYTKMTDQKNIIDICNNRSARLSLWDTLFRTVTSILSSFKKFPEFANIIDRNCCCK